MGDAYKIWSKNLKGKGQFRDVNMAVMIVLRWIITCFDLRLNDNSL